MSCTIMQAVCNCDNDICVDKGLCASDVAALGADCLDASITVDVHVSSAYEAAAQLLTQPQAVHDMNPRLTWVVSRHARPRSEASSHRRSFN